MDIGWRRLPWLKMNSLTHGEQQLGIWRKRTAKCATTFVYVIADGNAVKIGVAKDPMARMASLQCGNHRVLALAYCVPGTYDLEAYLHRQLATYRVQGEWFLLNDFAPTFGKYLTDLHDATLAGHDKRGVPPHFKELNVEWPVKAKPKNWRTKSGADPAPVTIRFVAPVKVTGPSQDPETHPLARRRISPSLGFRN